MSASRLPCSGDTISAKSLPAKKSGPSLRVWPVAEVVPMAT
jgi:hypothetical protein